LIAGVGEQSNAGGSIAGIRFMQLYSALRRPHRVQIPVPDSKA
jgi:hypothetical protein